MAAQRPLGAAGLLLALETSCGRPSVAVLRGEALLAEEHAAPGRTGAESLLPCVDAVLQRAGVGLAELDGFAVSIGPGSFTGLRVGVATLKGLAFGSDRPAAAVSTLAALAQREPATSAAVVPLLDARRGELYAAVFTPGEAEPAPGAPAEGVYTPEELAARLPERCVLVGEGVPLFGARLRALRGPGVRLGPASDPRAADVGALGRRLLLRGEGVDVAALVPRYLRRAEAEVQRTGERFE